MPRRRARRGPDRQLILPLPDSTKYVSHSEPAGKTHHRSALASTQAQERQFIVRPTHLGSLAYPIRQRPHLDLSLATWIIDEFSVLSGTW